MTILSILRFFSKIEVFCLNIILFIFILMCGTIAQKYIGIQAAQEKFFSSTVIWIFNVIPVPGGKISLFFMFLSLSCKFIDDKYTINKLGTVLIHIGVLCFIFGAFLMSNISLEGTIILKEGTTTNSFINKNDYDIVICDATTNKLINIIHNNKISVKMPIKFDFITITIEKFYKNSDLELNYYSENYFNIKNAVSFPESDYDKPSILICIKKNGYKNYIYLIEEFEYKFNYENEIIIKFSKSKNILPFDISLLKFEKHVYLQTSMAKSYNSSIFINSNNIKWKADIKMNKPFRLHSYTFYQTSFIEKDAFKATVLTVVKNYANNIFYLASVFIFLGLTYHIIRFFMKFKNE
ncbi:MAG TPA: cytochrome c biogenesis protein ResB [Candidatus Azoamicus sp. OHIO2]